MRNKKGFTLIELLAVIVILAVLMVIAVPKILDVIESSRKRAFENSYRLLTSTIKTQLASSNIVDNNFNKDSSGCYLFDFTNNNDNAKNLKVKNKETFTGSILYCDNKILYNELSNGSYTINKDIVYKNGEEVCDYEIGTEWMFDYSETEEEFLTPCVGYYKLETWGAQGGGNATGNKRGGFGAYSTGVVKLTKNEKLYINVGGSGTAAIKLNKGGYNGGGTREHVTSSDSYLGTGGGATHIATISGLLSELEEYKGTYNEETGTYDSPEILIVSGGGGGYYWYNNNYYGYGGDAGGINGGRGYSYRSGATYYTTPSTQNSGYAFGQGINGDIYSSGGGAGWYGGLKSSNNSGGGSSFIGSSRLISFKDTTKSMYCYSCTTSTNSETYTVSTTNISTDPVSEYAKQGNGYAKITLISY